MKANISANPGPASAAALHAWACTCRVCQEKKPEQLRSRVVVCVVGRIFNQQLAVRRHTSVFFPLATETNTCCKYELQIGFELRSFGQTSCLALRILMLLNICECFTSPPVCLVLWLMTDSL